MVDRIKITLKDFSGNFENCENITKKEFIEYPDRKQYDNFVLRNKTELDRHDLSISQAKKTGIVTIEGSIRKWNYNNATLLDLTQTSFERALRNIAKELNISFEELRQGDFTQCEIGLNINVSIQAIDVLPMVVNYAHLKRYADRMDEGTLYFIGSEKNAKLYAKSKEIAGKSSIIKQGKRREAFKIMQDKGNDFLRIEFTLKYQKSFNHHKMKHIQNLGDLADNYSDLYRFFAREVSRFILFNKLSYQEEYLTPKERHIIYGLENFGYETFLEDYQAEFVERASKPDTKKSAKSDVYKSVITVLKKYASPDDYNFKTFKNDIKETLFRKSKDEKVDFAELLGILEGNKKLSLPNK